MRQEDYCKLPQILRESRFRKSLAVLSVAHKSDGRTTEYCLDPESDVGKLEAIDFDAVKEFLRKDGFVFKGKSADALFISGDDYYLIEFKTGRINTAEILRKAYDSVMALIEFDVVEWQQCKSLLSFILVGTEAKERVSHLLKKSRDEYMSPTYKGVDADPRTIVGQIVKEFLICTHDDFNKFVSSRLWSN